ncbi:hypothetical protein PR001_g30757, partial [Phytophthora rubi]
MNEFGEGAVVQHSLLEANGDWHMDKAITHFKRLHLARIKLLRVIMVDKDMNEIRVLESNFPEACVLICHFHVIKYLKEMRSKPEFGKISSDDAVQIDACIHKLVYADSDISNEAAHFALKGLCERTGHSGFFDYFEKNWHECQDRWVMHRRADLPHFRSHTNNRLESFFGKLKDGVDGSKSMAECAKTLVAYDRRVENEYRYRLARIGQFVHSGYDEEMANVLRFTTPYVAGKVAEEYAFALDRLETYTFLRDDEDGHILHVDGGKKSYVFRDDDWRCDCEFSVSMRLPCRHVIEFRKNASAEGPVIPWASIDERWTSPLRELKKRIAFELSDIDETDEFRRSLDFLEQQWRNFRQKTCEVATPREPGEPGKHRSAAHNDSDSIDELKDQEMSSEGDSSEDKEVEEVLAGAPTIRLNPKARKVGRPKKQRQKTVASE